MSFWVGFFINITIGIPALISAWRFRVIHPVFRPFIYTTWLGIMNELISLPMMYAFHTNAVNSNIYVLIESLLIVWQFRLWDLFGKNKIIVPCLFVLLALTWLAENFFFFSISQFSSWFRILYSFITVLLSISLLNRQLVREKGGFLKNPVTLICLTYIMYFTYKVLVETFWVYGLNESSIFQDKVYVILTLINLFTNLMFALAVLWMPIKHRFTLPY